MSTGRILLLAVLLVYGIPLWTMRYQWRSTVYRMTHWKINVLPWFGRDIAALFTNRYFHNDEERRMARRFRVYLTGYTVLLLAFFWAP